MATMEFKFILMLILSLIITKGFSQQCTLNEINIGTARSGRMIQGKPEWNVTIYNNCKCQISGLVLWCTGFQTVEEIKPEILHQTGTKCIINNGQPLAESAAFQFSYAWDPPFFLTPSSANADC